MSILIKKYSITFFLLISSRYIYIEKKLSLKKNSYHINFIKILNIYLTTFFVIKYKFNFIFLPFLLFQNYCHKNIFYRAYIYIYQNLIFLQIKGIKKKEIIDYFSEIFNLIKEIDFRNLSFYFGELINKFGKTYFLKNNQDVNNLIYVGLFTLLSNHFIYSNTIIEFYIFLSTVIIGGSSFDFKILDTNNSIFSFFIYALIILNATSNFYLLLLPNIVFSQFLLKIIDPKIKNIIKVILYSKLFIQIL